MKKSRMIIDIAMLILMPLLMAYTLIGAEFHEIAGTIIFVLFIVHHYLNRGWYRTIGKGHQNVMRLVQTIMDLVLLIFMIAQPVSGILLSGYLFKFIHEPPAITSIARTMHLILAYWSFCLLSFHAGWHLSAPFRKLRDKSRRAFIILFLMAVILSVYGVVSFFRRQFLTYMLGRSPFVFFDFREPRIYFFADYIAIMVLFMMIGLLVKRSLEHGKVAHQK